MKFVVAVTIDFISLRRFPLERRSYFFAFHCTYKIIKKSKSEETA